MPKLSANLGFLFDDRPILDRVAASGAAGFRAVEFHWPFEIPPAAMRAALAAAGTVPLAVNVPLGGPDDFGLASAPGREVAFRETFATALDWVVAVGGTAVHCVAGVAAEVTARHRDTLTANLADAAARAAPHGIAILVEMINQRDRPGFVIRSIEEAAAIVRDTGHANARVMFDTYHVQIMQGDVVRRLERHLDVIGHVQVAAVPDRGEPDGGELDHAFVLSELDRLGYTGWVGAEYRPRAGRTEDGLGWRDRLAARGVVWT